MKLLDEARAAVQFCTEPPWGVREFPPERGSAVEVLGRMITEVERLRSQNCVFAAHFFECVQVILALSNLYWDQKTRCHSHHPVTIHDEYVTAVWKRLATETDAWDQGGVDLVRQALTVISECKPSAAEAKNATK
jgi:hypothetical protein